MRGARHATLRSHTAASHAALDAFVGRAGFFKTPSGYERYLRHLYRFHAAFDPQARRISSDLFSRWGVDGHATLLARDLDALGSSILEHASPEAAFVPAGRSSLIGALYVLIGSSLGARVLLPWARGLGLPGDGAVAYLGHLSRSRDWPAFVAFLEAEGDIDEQVMIEGAEATFAAIHAALSERQTA